jgi:transcriptional regulator with XRE-family HTH domain
VDADDRGVGGPAGMGLRELRRDQGRTQAEVAKALGVSQSRVSQIENHDLATMELDTLRTYAAALGGLVAVTVSIGSRSVQLV